MKTPKLFTLTLIFVFIVNFTFAQNNNQKFKMSGINSASVELNQTFSTSAEIFPFAENDTKIYGLEVNAKINLKSEESLVRLLLVDNNFKEYLIYETYSLLESTPTFSLENICEETSVLNGVKMYSVKLEITNAEITVNNFSYTTEITPGTNNEKLKKEKKQGQNELKINKLNKNLKARGFGWVAGPTEVSELSYTEKKALFGQSTFPAGIEYYAGGVISTGPALKSVSASNMVEEWDWRNRHGQNWVTPVTNQGGCGSCWSFAATGATEALANLFFNQQLNLDLSEQDVLSCSGAGSCGGGYPSIALDYITNTGVVDEGAFPYAAADLPCTDKSISPSELIKIGGRINFGTTEYPKTEDVLKKMIIDNGPVSGGLTDWSHAMVLVGYKVVAEGDVFYYRDLTLSRYTKTVESGDPLIGKTVWIFKNSWGPYFGDAGYIYVETPITNINWTHALQTPVTSNVKNYEVICEDNDGDGYFWWGLGEKPASCTGPDQADGDDSNPALGPLDEFGNCTILTAPPVANFTSDITVITEGEEVSFSDISENNPIAWMWEFEGGEPATSNLKNPKVKYNTPNKYGVKLTVQGAGGTDTKIIEEYVQVDQYIPDYCSVEGNATEEWIASVQFGETINTSGAVGYEDFTSVVFDFDSGNTYDLTLTPGFSARKQAEYWSVWIDYNGDADFDDAGELVFSTSKKRAAVSGAITIPEGISIETRMRVALSRTAPSNCGFIELGEVEDYTVRINEIMHTFSAYCEPQYINSSTDFIQNVSIENILNNTSAGNNYSLSETPVSFVAGSNYSISLTPQVAKNRNFWGVWMDLNNDGDFDDAGECLLNEGNKRGTVSSTLFIPEYATGTTRMRISMKNGKAPSPCEDNFDGEVEDYVVNFEQGVSMFKSAFIDTPNTESQHPFSVYPNPVNNNLNIQLGKVETGDLYTIYNMNGKKISTNQITSTHTNIDFSEYISGMYLVVVINNGEVFKEKVVKK